MSAIPADYFGRVLKKISFSHKHPAGLQYRNPVTAVSYDSR